MPNVNEILFHKIKLATLIPLFGFLLSSCFATAPVQPDFTPYAGRESIGSTAADHFEPRSSALNTAATISTIPTRSPEISTAPTPPAAADTEAQAPAVCTDCANSKVVRAMDPIADPDDTYDDPESVIEESDLNDDTPLAEMGSADVPNPAAEKITQSFKKLRMCKILYRHSKSKYRNCMNNGRNSRLTDRKNGAKWCYRAVKFAISDALGVPYWNGSPASQFGKHLRQAGNEKLRSRLSRLNLTQSQVRQAPPGSICYYGGGKLNRGHIEFFGTDGHIYSDFDQGTKTAAAWGDKNHPWKQRKLLGCYLVR